MAGWTWQAIAAEVKGIARNFARNTAGNTLAIMAAALIPLAGFAGSAIDMARLYVVKVRLQQACDAGVLAGRKFMTDTTAGTALDDTAKTQAQTFFKNNFTSGWYQTNSVTFTPNKVQDSSNPTIANTVAAKASATVPMTLLQLFGKAPVTINVSCQAHFDLADTDVMFVLDTTGSMSCLPSDPDNCAAGMSSYTREDGTTGYYDVEKSGSKLEALRQAVVLFDSTMRANSDPSTHIRYGFVPYSSAVNIGYSIPAAYLETGSWTYQTRLLKGDYNFGSATQMSITGIPQSYCVNQRYPATGYALTGPTWSNAGYVQAAQYSGVSWTSANNGTCAGTQQMLRPLWTYTQASLDVSKYSQGQTILNPTRLDGLTTHWRGCVEEADTTPSTSFDIDNLPDDLNPDRIPSGTSRWRPMWPDVEWLRNGTPAQDVKDENVNEGNPSGYEDVNYRAGDPFDQSGAAACGKKAQTLQTMSAQDVHNYVYGTDFKPFGGTYHDVGMIWGVRMISPNGVFASTTAPWPGRNPPSRNIVFVTDGAMAPQTTIYGEYGVELLDMRVDGSSSNFSSDTARHTARFRAECDYAKSRLGITIYVVAVGTALSNDLTYCASPGQAFQASSTSQLTAAFAAIAKRVAMLRITL